LLLTIGSLQHAHAFRLASQLVRCSDIPWTGTCGGDALTEGRIKLKDNGTIQVGVKGALADPFNLYEVYWLPIGAAVTSAIAVGHFGTDCHGHFNAQLRDITTPDDIRHGPVTDIYTLVGDTSAGNFLLYSRGPWAFDTDGDCSIEQLNTVPLGTDPTLPLANPPVVLSTSGVQFLSGYER
jgi:hypothetical protein